MKKIQREAIPSNLEGEGKGSWRVDLFREKGNNSELKKLKLSNRMATNLIYEDGLDGV